MPKMRSPYNEPRHVPWLGRDVEPDQVVDIPEVYEANFLAAGWEVVETSPRSMKSAPKTETKEG